MIDNSGEKAVWDCAAKLAPECRVTVQYWSKRAEGVREMDGVVFEVVARSGLCRVDIERDDGQHIQVKNDGGVYSIGSNYPHNGDVVKLLIDGQPLWAM